MINFTGHDNKFNLSDDLIDATKKILQTEAEKNMKKVDDKKDDSKCDKSDKKSDDKKDDDKKDDGKKKKWKDFFKKKEVKEEENLTELSKPTLSSYVKKAEPDAIEARRRHTDAKLDGDKPSADAYLKKSKNRMKGMDTAVDKLTKEEDELNELSKDTLKSYVGKAKVDMSNQAMARAHHMNKSYSVAKTGDSEKDYNNVLHHHQKAVKADDKLYARSKGITLANKKLAKEEINEGVFQLNNLQWQTKVFDTEEAANAFLEDNEDYGYIGTVEGIHHCAKVDDEGTQLQELSKDTLHSYLKKNYSSSVDAIMDGDKKKLANRDKGSYAATERIIGLKKTSPASVKEDLNLTEEEIAKHPGHEFLNRASKFFKSNPDAYKTTELKYTGPSMSKTKAVMSMAHLGYDHLKTHKDGESFSHPKLGCMKVKFNGLHEDDGSTGAGNMAGVMGIPPSQQTSADDGSSGAGVDSSSSASNSFTQGTTGTGGQ